MDPRAKPGAPAAVDVEAGMPPGENALGSFRAQQLLADKHRQYLAGEDLGQPRVVQARDLMEDTRRVHSALGHQKMQVGVKIDPIPERLDGGDDAGRRNFCAGPWAPESLTVMWMVGKKTALLDYISDVSRRCLIALHLGHSFSSWA